MKIKKYHYRVHSWYISRFRSQKLNTFFLDFMHTALCQSLDWFFLSDMNYNSWTSMPQHLSWRYCDSKTNSSCHGRVSFPWNYSGGPLVWWVWLDWTSHTMPFTNSSGTPSITTGDLTEFRCSSRSLLGITSIPNVEQTRFDIWPSCFFSCLWVIMVLWPNWCQFNTSRVYIRVLVFKFMTCFMYKGERMNLLVVSETVLWVVHS